MPIEFKCPSCSSLLRVGDELAGKPAKCPSCQTVSTIPSGSAPLGGPPPSDNPFADIGGKPAGAPQIGPPGGGVPGAPQINTGGGGGGGFAGINTGGGGGGMPGPMPGVGNSANPYAAKSAPQMPTHDMGGQGRPTAVDAGRVFSFAQRLWSANLGLLLGVTIIVFAVSMGISFVQGFSGAMMRQGGNHEAAAIVELVLNLTSQLVQMFLGIGATRIYLALGRGQRAELGMLFGGVDALGGVFVSSLCFGIVLVIGFVLLIIPGILLLLFFWPFYYFIVDKQCATFDSFSRGYELAKLNAGTTFVLWLMSVGIMLLGLLACGIGIVFAAPLVGLMWSIGYLAMKGEIRV